MAYIYDTRPSFLSQSIVQDDERSSKPAQGSTMYKISRRMEVCVAMIDAVGARSRVLRYDWYTPSGKHPCVNNYTDSSHTHTHTLRPCSARRVVSTINHRTCDDRPRRTPVRTKLALKGGPPKDKITRTRTMLGFSLFLIIFSTKVTDYFSTILIFELGVLSAGEYRL